MATHDLKTWPEPFQAMAHGTKTHEVRKDDRQFVAGDVLHLREWCPKSREFTGRILYGTVTHKTVGGEFGLPADLCVMSVEIFARQGF